MSYYFSVLRNFSFQGRARRAEYWWWFLFTLIITVVLAVASDMLHLNVPLGGEPPPTYGYSQSYELRIPVVIYLLLTIFQSFAVGVRRLHDRNMSGWWLLIGLIPLLGAIALIVIYAQSGTKGENRFGPDPKAGG